MRASMPLHSAATVVAAGVALTLAALLASLALGVIHLSLADVGRALLGGADATCRTLVLQMRLPRAVGAACVGAALATAGCLLHALLRNPLASPSLIGTAQAAGFGRVLGVFLGWPFLASVSLSFATAIGGTLLVFVLARAARGFASDVVILTGVNVALFFGALIALVQFMARDEGQLSRMLLMLLGGLWQVTWTPLAAIGPAIAFAVAVACLLGRPLDLMALGDADARRLGLRVERAGPLVLLLACLLTSLAVSLAGIVAFVGLIVPHAARRIVGPAYARLLPASAFLGAALVIATDTLARSIVPPNELPLGVVTSLLGVPCFVVVLRSLRTPRRLA